MARQGGSQQLTVTRQETASSYALPQKPCMPSTFDVLDSAHWESAQAWLYRSTHGRREAHALTRTALSMELEDVMQLDALQKLVSENGDVRKRNMLIFSLFAMFGVCSGVYNERSTADT